MYETRVSQTTAIMLMSQYLGLNLEPTVVKAIMIAEGKQLCNKEYLDLTRCRESMVRPGKILLFNKKGFKVALIAI